MSEIAGQCLLDALGGEAACLRMSQAFYHRVATNSELQPLFPGKSLRCATEEFAAFLVQFLDGDPDRTQYRWWLSLRESHARFEISESQRTTWVALMAEALETCVADEHLRQRFEQFFSAASTYVAGHGGGEIEDPRLRGRWHWQLELDRLIALIASRQDDEAISLASQFAGRRDVFVGILARMMYTGRESLIAYVVGAIADHDALADSRFNGRTVLHYAAGFDCLPVVRAQLVKGVDPDVLDSGGHTPLYRAASRAGADVILELVKWGAQAGACGGVSRSTPLHQAARYGNFEGASALLGAGASPTARDRKGLTPWDRAVNCRKHAVAELLASHMGSLSGSG